MACVNELHSQFPGGLKKDYGKSPLG